MFNPFRRNRAPGPEGLFVRQHETGAKREEGRYVDGRRQGPWLRWYEDGTLEEESSYRDGRLHGPVTRYYPTGQVQAEFDLCWGALQGPFARFHPNGRLAEEGEWIDGQPHRAYCRWWPNGQKRLEGAFHHGQPVGEWTAWTPDGGAAFRGRWRPELASGRHLELRTAIRPGDEDPAVTTIERLGWKGTYTNVAGGLTCRRGRGAAGPAGRKRGEGSGSGMAPRAVPHAHEPDGLGTQPRLASGSRGPRRVVGRRSREAGAAHAGGAGGGGARGRPRPGARGCPRRLRDSMLRTLPCRRAARELEGLRQGDL